MDESQRNLWLQAGYLKYTDPKHLTLPTTHTCTAAALHLLIALTLHPHTHVDCILGLALEPLTVARIKPR